MLGLPISTQVNKPLPKAAIYRTSGFDSSARAKIDGDISRIVIVNEITPQNMGVSPGEVVKSFFVLDVVLKNKNFDEKTLISLFKLIPQNLIMALEYDGFVKIAVYCRTLLHTPWLPPGQRLLPLKGRDLDRIWENIILWIGGISLDGGIALEDRLLLNEQREKLSKQIRRLEKRSASEKQPRKKYEIARQIRQLRKQLENLNTQNTEVSDGKAENEDIGQGR